MGNFGEDAVDEGEDGLKAKEGGLGGGEVASGEGAVGGEEGSVGDADVFDEEGEDVASGDDQGVLLERNALVSQSIDRARIASFGFSWAGTGRTKRIFGKYSRRLACSR